MSLRLWISVGGKKVGINQITRSSFGFCRRVATWRIGCHVDLGLGSHQPLDVVEKALERDNFMSPQEAKDWGHIDEILERRPTTEE